MLLPSITTSTLAAGVTPQIQKRGDNGPFEGFMMMKVLLPPMYSHMEATPMHFEMGPNAGKVLHLNAILIMNSCKVSQAQAQ